MIKNKKARHRAILWERQKGLCCYCGIPMTKRERTPKDYNYPDDATLDHVHPKSKGGIRNNLVNLRLCCFSCNQKKANKCEPELSQCSLDITSFSCTL